ncbi:hypothetical protein [Sporosarcina sp. P34]|uniref:MerR family transcriptional regulator n=1 Tax=Sporosarcina sp. P34 TaxID=2048247 RepID=UPI001E47CD32|nr:hypothetical protein [Sporosarcina sp. P34]
MSERFTPEQLKIAESNGITRKMLTSRLKDLGWDIQKAVTRPVTRRDNNAEYAMYKGEEFLYTGTISELAKRHGVSENTIRYYTYPAYQNKLKKRRKVRNVITVDRLDDDED